MTKDSPTHVQSPSHTPLKVLRIGSINVINIVFKIFVIIYWIKLFLVTNTKLNRITSFYFHAFLKFKCFHHTIYKNIKASWFCALPLHRSHTNLCIIWILEYVLPKRAQDFHDSLNRLFFIKWKYMLLSSLVLI